MTLYTIVGKGIVKEVTKSKDGKSIVVLPDDWDAEQVRVYQLRRLGFKKNKK